MAAQITPREGDTPEATVVLPGRDGTVLYTMGPSFALGEDAISTAEASVINGEWVVDLELQDGQRGLDAWNTWAGKCYSRDTECPTGGMAIVLDGRVIAAPVPQDPFFTNTSVQVSGGGSGFAKDEARDLARILKYGGVPVQLEPQAAQTVSATLGKDSLRAGLIAGFVGVLLVLILMILYYRSLAILVVLGLILTGCLLWTTISILSTTSGLSLTLAGVTGIIVSIGVTVDSYVVFLERLKDDVRSGKSLRASTPRSFKSAWRTILAADIVSLIGAGVLWYLSVGSVRGFAFFLGLSTILDLIVTWFFVRPAALLVSQAQVYRGADVLGVHTGEAILAGGTA